MFRDIKRRNSQLLRPNIIIIGDGLTEFYYFKHLKKLKHRRLSITLDKSYFDKSQNIYKRIRKIKSGIFSVIIAVFDIENDENKIKLFEEKLKSFKKVDVIKLYSNPSIEYWFLLHYEDTNRHFNAYELKSYIRKYINEYSTSENFLKNEKWVINLLNNLNHAIERAKKYQNKNQSYTNIYEGIEKLEEVIKLIKY